VTADSLAPLLAGPGPLLLDFDGPVCSIFGGHPAPGVAGRLRAVLRDQAVNLDGTVLDEPDPLEVLRWAHRLGVLELTRAVDDALRVEELAAARSAIPTPYAREVIVSARQAGKPIAVVSNNSGPAIHAYLSAQRLAGHITHVVGRAYAQPERMKPNPDPILCAVLALNSVPGACVLIGDSDTDLLGAQAAGVPVIAYANKPAKVQRFTDARANAVITSMAQIAGAILDANSD
jgi:beta-phosphoglucomutase-like phosphatase (HAD superfamily)